MGITTGDINKDGKPDLLVANRSAGKISLLLGDGSGGFAAAVSPTVGTNPTALTVSDVNRDGNPDVLVANNVTSNISLLLGDGAGNLPVAGTNFASGSGPRSIRTADLDLDGAPDLLVAGSGLHTHRNNGSGGFLAPTTIGIGSTPAALVVADFNNDGKVDVAAANQSSAATVGVLLGNGTGGFTGSARTINLGNVATAIAAGDMDQDGKVDLAVTIGSAPTYEVRVLKGVGDGTFTAMATLTLTIGSPGVDGVAIGDIDGDGRLDIAVTTPASDSVVVWRGNGAGGFIGPVSWSSGDTTSSLTLADLNSDGLLDVATGGVVVLSVLLGR
jgi:hypothetical protein